VRHWFKHNGECVGNLRDLQARAARPKGSAFKACEPGYLHVDVKYLPQMADESSSRYLFVAIDRATRWVFIRIFKARTAANARRCLRDLERACPIRIRMILTDNGKAFTDRLFGLSGRAATGAHAFDRLCAELDIEHRLTPPKSLRTNGMVERFNGRIEEVLQSHHVRSGEDLETTLHRYVRLYNQQLPQSALGSKTPLQAIKDWHTSRSCSESSRDTFRDVTVRRGGRAAIVARTNGATMACCRWPSSLPSA
jgi:transposase InsO family protein